MHRPAAQCSRCGRPHPCVRTRSAPRRARGWRQALLYRVVYPQAGRVPHVPARWPGGEVVGRSPAWSRAHEEVRARQPCSRPGGHGPVPGRRVRACWASAQGAVPLDWAGSGSRQGGRVRTRFHDFARQQSWWESLDWEQVRVSTMEWQAGDLTKENARVRKRAADRRDRELFEAGRTYSGGHATHRAEPRMPRVSPTKSR